MSENDLHQRNEQLPMPPEEDEQERRENHVVDTEIRAAERVVDEVRKGHTAQQLAENPFFMDSLSRLERSEEAHEVAELLRNFENVLPEMNMFLAQFVQELLEEGTDFEKLHKDHVSFLRHMLLLYRDMKQIKDSAKPTKT